MPNQFKYLQTICTHTHTNIKLLLRSAIQIYMYIYYLYMPHMSFLVQVSQPSRITIHIWFSAFFYSFFFIYHTCYTKVYYRHVSLGYPLLFKLTWARVHFISVVFFLSPFSFLVGDCATKEEKKEGITISFDWIKISATTNSDPVPYFSAFRVKKKNSREYADKTSVLWSCRRFVSPPWRDECWRLIYE